MLCAAGVSHCKPLSKWLPPQCYKILKGIQKNSVFGYFRKSQQFKFAANYQKIDNIESNFRSIFYSIFWYNLKTYCISLVLTFPLSQLYCGSSSNTPQGTKKAWSQKEIHSTQSGMKDTRNFMFGVYRKLKCWGQVH